MSKNTLRFAAGEYFKEKSGPFGSRWQPKLCCTLISADASDKGMEPKIEWMLIDTKNSVPLQLNRKINAKKKHVKLEPAVVNSNPKMPHSSPNLRYRAGYNANL